MSRHCPLRLSRGSCRWLAHGDCNWRIRSGLRGCFGNGWRSTFVAQVRLPGCNRRRCCFDRRASGLRLDRSGLVRNRLVGNRLADRISRLDGRRRFSDCIRRRYRGFNRRDFVLSWRQGRRSWRDCGHLLDGRRLDSCGLRRLVWRSLRHVVSHGLHRCRLWIAGRTFLQLGRNLAPALRADPVEHDPIYPEFVFYPFGDIPYPDHLGTLSGLGIQSQAHLRR